MIVPSNVFTVRSTDDQVLWTIVRAIAIDVVNDFAGPQSAAEYLLCDDAVLKGVDVSSASSQVMPASDPDENVSFGSQMPAGAPCGIGGTDRLAHQNTVTLPVTGWCCRHLLAGFPLKDFAADRTGKGSQHIQW